MDSIDPRHGSYAGAQQHWKDGESACEQCLVASRRSNKRRDLNILAGNPARVPLGEAAYRIVVQSPRAQLAAATGIYTPRLRDFEIAGPTKMVHRNTRARILAAGRPWTGIGIQRRLQALAAGGWSGRVIAERTGVYESALCNLRRRENIVFVRAHVAAAVVELYAEIGDQEAPAGRSSTEARNHARSEGWSPAHAWLDIDDPTEIPDPGWSPRRKFVDADEYDQVVVARILNGDWRLPATVAEKVEVLRQWAAEGGSDNGLEKLTGWKISRDVRPHLPREEDAA